MKGSFWSSGGFRDKAKHVVVHQKIWEHKLVVVLEPDRDNFSTTFFRNQLGA
jgi:hypothetical protein